MAEQAAHNRSVVGSNPTLATNPIVRWDFLLDWNNPQISQIRIKFEDNPLIYANPREFLMPLVFDAFY